MDPIPRTVRTDHELFRFSNSCVLLVSFLPQTEPPALLPLESISWVLGVSRSLAEAGPGAAPPLEPGC